MEENNTDITEVNRKEPPEGKEYDSSGRLVFKKGFSGNPAGKPKGAISLIAILRNKLEEQVDDNKGGKIKLAQVLINVLIGEAIKSKDIRAIREVLDRCEGKPFQAMDITSGGENALPILYNIYRVDSDEERERVRIAKENGLDPDDSSKIYGGLSNKKKEEEPEPVVELVVEEPEEPEPTPEEPKEELPVEEEKPTEPEYLQPSASPTIPTVI